MAEDDWGPPFDVEPQEMTLESDGVTLSMTVWARAPKPVEVPEGKKAPKIKEGAPEAPPRSWCILVHGLLSDRNEFGRLGPHLASQGYGVIAVDLRGHGKSGGPRGVFDLDLAVSDLRKVIAHFESRHEQWDLNPQQWGIVGHSYGGLVALKLGHYLHSEDAIVALSPPRNILEETNALRRIGYWLAYRLSPQRNGDQAGPTLKYPVSYRDLFVDSDARQRAERMGFLQDRVPIRNYPIMRDVDGEAIAREVREPAVLVLYADRDRVVKQASSQAIYDAVASTKDLKVVEDSGHSIMLDGKGDEVIELVTTWLDKRLQAFNEVRVGHTKR